MTEFKIPVNIKIQITAFAFADSVAVMVGFVLLIRRLSAAVVFLGAEGAEGVVPVPFSRPRSRGIALALLSGSTCLYCVYCSSVFGFGSML